MTTIFVNKIVESDFNSIDDLKGLFYSNAYNGIVLGVKFGDKLATVEQKKPFKNVSGWRISYGKDLGKAFVLESKASSPNDFVESMLCSVNYTVETL